VVTATSDNIAQVLDAARAEHRRVLLQPEAARIVECLGIEVPAAVLVRSSADVDDGDLRQLGTDLVVIKAVSARIVHKTEVGAVAIVRNHPGTVREAVRTMESSLAEQAVVGFALNAHVDYDRALGGELLLGMRWTDDFGPVVTIGPGGMHAELLSAELQAGRAAAVFGAHTRSRNQIERSLASKAFARLAAGMERGGGGGVAFDMPVLVSLVETALAFARSDAATQIGEFEINPLVPGEHGPTALDVLVTLRAGEPGRRPDRPIHKLKALLEPKSAAIVGVSERLNPGRIILRNMLREGFPAERMAIVKPDAGEIDGVRCFASITALPGCVDLLVLSVAASQVPDAVREVVAGRKAESLIVIPGGLGEKGGTAQLQHDILEALHASRPTEWGGPVLNGGNCLGVRSIPGRYDTTFIPEYKLPPKRGAATPLALISQSGAFAVARASRFLGLNPRFSISVGNQTDLTVSDYLTYLKDDPEIDVFACYVEGFQPGDGHRWLDAAAEIASSGRDVVLYRAGRTPAGAGATASHTAAVAGDYAVCRELATEAGVVVADSLADFDDLVKVFCYLGRRVVRGSRLGAVSNAGFECVTMADNLGPFQLAPFTGDTVRRLGALLTGRRLQDVVEARNPLDLTPIMDDAGYEEAMTTVLCDENVDVGIVGCVPLTGALNTLARDATHGEDIDDPQSVVRRLIATAQTTTKPWVAVVDAGPRYVPMATLLEQHGIPTFRTADRALRIFGTYCERRLRCLRQGT
jgi:acyl-CoA synthetase (NDP forming)